MPLGREVVLLSPSDIVKRFALCYQTVVCPVCLATFVLGWHPDSPPPKGAQRRPEIFGPYLLAHWLDGLGCHLAWR